MMMVVAEAAGAVAVPRLQLPRLIGCHWQVTSPCQCVLQMSPLDFSTKINKQLISKKDQEFIKVAYDKRKTYT